MIYLFQNFISQRCSISLPEVCLEVSDNLYDLPASKTLSSQCLPQIYMYSGIVSIYGLPNRHQT